MVASFSLEYYSVLSDDTCDSVRGDDLLSYIFIQLKCNSIINLYIALSSSLSGG